ncbi:hypothetical protein DL93DRAFT_2233938 [Clavulina sp. PMI_390]|nr:hypothetical protein DL93DRAFT_2233938 [Clavulina sp. PMI_390]
MILGSTRILPVQYEVLLQHRGERSARSDHPRLLGLADPLAQASPASREPPRCSDEGPSPLHRQRPEAHPAKLIEPSSPKRACCSDKSLMTVCKARATSTSSLTASSASSAAPQTTSAGNTQLNNCPSLFSCPSKAKMTADFKQMRNTYGARYVRQYGNCDGEPADMLDKMIEAAYANGMGVVATLWLGWDASDTTWKTRKAHMEATIKNNPLAPYVIRSFDVGTEPLMDQPVNPSSVLIPMIKEVKAIAEPKGVQVGISELRYSYGLVGSSVSSQIFSLGDYVHAHELPFLSGSATTGSAAWPSLQSDLKWFSQQSNGKKITLTETGWPRNTAEWKSGSKNAVASTSSSEGWMNVLNDHCSDMKSIAGKGGVGWFWSTWNDGDIPGYGVVDSSGKATFSFKGVTC